MSEEHAAHGHDGHGTGVVPAMTDDPGELHVPHRAWLFVLFSMLIVIMQGIFVAALSSDFGRIWPAADSLKIPLPPMS